MKHDGRILALAGGVGGAKMALGLTGVLAPDDLQIVVNTADDFEHLGVHVSPDLDSVMYALAGIANQTTGWGIEGDTWNFIDAIGRLGGEIWFSLGDRDLATNAERTRLLREGWTLSRVTQHLASQLGVAHPIAPMSDDPVRTVVDSTEGRLPFQDYFVRRKCEPAVHGFHFDGVNEARAAPPFVEALEDSSLAGIVICPSNPFVSIDPILALPDIRPALKDCTQPVIAVSPIIGGRAVKGPAAKMMREMNVEPSALSIAGIYAGLVDGLIIDDADRDQAPDIEALGMRVLTTRTFMKTREHKIRLAKEALDFIADLRNR